MRVARVYSRYWPNGRKASSPCRDMRGISWALIDTLVAIVAGRTRDGAGHSIGAVVIVYPRRWGMDVIASSRPAPTAKRHPPASPALALGTGSGKTPSGLGPERPDRGFDAGC